MSDLRAAVEEMRRCRKDYDESCVVVWSQLLASHPELRELLSKSGIDKNQSCRWFCARRFDEGTKSAAELFAEDRGEEVMLLLGQMTAGVYL